MVFTPEERAAATSGGGAKLVDVVQFVDQDEIDPIYYKSAYYLAPESTGVKAYEILRAALVEKNRIGICKVAIRDREHLATLRADDQVLILETMRWPTRSEKLHSRSSKPTLRFGMRKSRWRR